MVSAPPATTSTPGPIPGSAASSDTRSEHLRGSVTADPLATAAVLPPDRHGVPIDQERAQVELQDLSPQERLAWGLETFGEGLALTSSFGIQSAVLLHMLSELAGGSTVPVLWVDTGYLPPETYRYAAELQERLGFDLRVVQAGLSPARMEALHGRLWESGTLADLELYNRLRKVEPLERGFAELEVCCWASGVRGGQTDHRSTMAVIDGVRGRWALRPLLAWSRRDVYYYMERHGLPQHPLFEQGYSTVGDWHSSGPDTASAAGRATRFGGLKQECGIHLPGLMGEGI